MIKLKFKALKNDFILSNTHVKKRITGIIQGTLTAAASKATGLLTTILSVYWATNYLSTESFGLWMSITSLIAILSLADFGINNSVVNLVSESFGEKNTAKLNDGISNSFLLMLIIGSSIGAILLLVSPYIKWSELFGITENNTLNDIGMIISLAVIIFSLTMPFSIVTRVQIGMQESWRVNLWQIIGSLLSIIGIFFAIKYDMGLIGILFASLALPLISLIFNYCDYFFLKQPQLRPKFDHFNKKSITELTNVSSVFFVLQILALIGNGIDNILIANILGSSAVGAYAVTQKLAISLNLAPLFIIPLWPAIGDALARGEICWAKSSITHSIYISIFLGIIVGVIIIFFGKDMIYYWTSNTMNPSNILVWGFAVHSILIGVGGSIAAFLNNKNYLKKQMTYYLIATIAATLIKIILLNYWHDAGGAIWGGIIGYTLFFIYPSLILIYTTPKD